MSKRVAILDLGTNTFHLLIAEIFENGFNIIYKEKIAVKIGKGGINQKTITSDAFQRALDAIHAFAGIIEHMNVSEIKATATSAIRNAINGPDLLQKIKQQSGISISTISGDEEAELIFFGVNTALQIGKKPVLVMDIGGGSVEFIIGSDGTIHWKRSYEIGAQRLVDRFHKNDPISPEELDNLYSFLEEELQELIVELISYNPTTLIGSSGTFDTLSDMYCEMENIAKNLTDTEVPFSMASFQDIYSMVITKNKIDRLNIPGMIEMRVDMIVVAAALINFILKKHNFEAIRVSTYALKEGILYKQFIEHDRTTV